MGMYDWLQDQPTNPPVPGSTPDRNIPQGVTPFYGMGPKDYQPKDGDFIITPGNLLGANALVEEVGGTFFQRFQGVQTAIEYLFWHFKETGSVTQAWQRLNNGQLSPMVIEL